MAACFRAGTAELYHRQLTRFRLDTALYAVVHFSMVREAKKLTAVRIEQTDLDALAKIGQREDRTQSYLICLAIKEFVARRGKKK